MIRACFLALALLAHAASFAQVPVRIVVPLPAGGPNDALARVLATPLAELLNRPVIVDNKPGGNGTIAAEYVLRLPRDGQALLLTGTGFATAAALGQQRFDARRDFAPVIHAARGEYFLVASTASGITSVDSLRRYAASKPQGINCGAVPGGLVIGCEQLRYALGGASTTIVYPGAQAALTAVIGGQIEVALTLRAAVVQLAASRRINVVAVVSERAAAPPFDHLPLLSDTWPEIVARSDAGLFVAAGTPPAVVNSLNEALNKVLARPEVRDEIEALGFWVVGGTAEAHGEWLGREIARVQEMARRLRAQGSDMRW